MVLKLAIRFTDDLVRLAGAGDGFSFGAANCPTEDLARIAIAVSKSGGRI